MEDVEYQDYLYKYYIREYFSL